MKKLFSVLFIAVLLSAISSSSFSQVTTIPAGGSPYASLNAAFAAINAGGPYIGVNVTVIITADLVEAAQANLNGGIFTSCLIMPQGPRMVTLNANASVINLNGADNVTIDGLNSGGNSLTVVNPNAGTGANGIQCTNGASNNTIRNVNCVGLGASQGAAGGRGVNIGQSAAGTGGNNDNTIENVNTNGFRRGIQNFGTAGLFINERTIVRGCTIRNFTSLGIFVGSEVADNLVENNLVTYDAAVPNDAAGSRAINIQGCGTSVVRSNIIRNLGPGLFAGGYIGIIAIPIIFTAPIVTPRTKIEIYNNMVALNNCIATAPFVYGIFPTSNPTTTNYTVNVYYNSVRIGGSSGVTAAVLTIGMAVLQDGLHGPDTSRVYNNISDNDRTDGDAASLHVGQNLDPEPGVALEADNNVAHTDDTTARGWDYWYENFLYEGEAGMHLLHDTTCAADIEQNTVFIYPQFVSDTDLHLNAALIGLNMDAKVNTPKPVTTDIDGQSRDITGTNYFTYRGCDEVYGGKRCWIFYGEFQEVQCYQYIVCIWLRYIVPPYEIWDCWWCRVRVWILKTWCVTVYIGPAVSTGGNQKYIEVLTKNTIRTQSANPLDFTNPTGTYNFTTAATQAYGNNQIPQGPGFAMYTGDVNQDDIIDGSDGAAVDNDAFNFVSGCNINTDVNSDGIVDGSDGAIVDNNAFNFVGAILLPGTAPTPGPGPCLKKFDAESATREQPPIHFLARNNMNTGL